MTNEEIMSMLTAINNKLSSLEKLMKESFEGLDHRMTDLEEGYECSQDRFDVLEEHMVIVRDDIDLIKAKYGLKE